MNTIIDYKFLLCEFSGLNIPHFHITQNSIYYVILQEVVSVSFKRV